MLWRAPWRRTSPSRSPLTRETLVAQALAPLAPQVTALTALLPQAVVPQTVLPVLQRLTDFCWDLPASEASYQSRPFGLLTRSLEIAQHALIAFTRSSLWWTMVPDPAQRHRTEGCWRLGTALAGLLSEAGIVFDVTVTLPATPAWDPLHAPLLGWLLAHQTSGVLPTPTVTWRPDCGVCQASLRALVAALVLTQDDLVALSLPVARELWTYLGGDPDPTNLFRQLLAECTASTEFPPPQPTLAAQVLAMLAQCCQEGTLRVNQFPGQVFVQEDATLVVVPAALDTVRQRLAATGVRVPGNPVLFHELAAAGALLGTAGQNIVKAVFPRAGKDPVTLGVLRLPHALLWGATPPLPYDGAILLDLPAEAVPEPIPAPAIVAAP